MKTQVLVEIVRGGTVETRHRGALAVVDCQGSELHVAGDVDQLVFIRSSVKPFAAALLVASGAADALGIPAPELAVVAGSHGGTDEDAALVTSLLERIGRTEADLRNGSGGPADEGTKIRLAAAEVEAGPVRQMCSGEHAGLLALCAHRGWPIDRYWEPDHPVQEALEALVSRVFAGGDGIPSATDDCAVPTWQVPLRSIARAYSWLARPERLPAELRDLEEAFRRVRDAMLANPVRISGPGQLDTDLTATDGAFVAKEGAEGLLGIGSVGTGLGVALMVEDGDKTRRAAAVVALATLSGLRLLDDDAEGRLRARHWQPIRDSLDRPVSEARAVFHLPAAE